MAGFGDIVGHEQVISHLKMRFPWKSVSCYILNGPEELEKE